MSAAAVVMVGWEKTKPGLLRLPVGARRLCAKAMAGDGGRRWYWWQLLSRGEGRGGEDVRVISGVVAMRVCGVVAMLATLLYIRSSGVIMVGRLDRWSGSPLSARGRSIAALYFY